MKQILLLVIRICTAACTLSWRLSLTVRQTEGQSHTQMNQQQPRLNYNRKVPIICTRDIPRAPSSGDQEDCSSGSHRTPKNTRSHMDLPNTKKQTQKGSQNGETKKHTLNELTGEFYTERAKWNGGKQFIRYRVQSNGYKVGQQHEKGNKNQKQGPDRSEKYSIWNVDYMGRNK